PRDTKEHGNFIHTRIDIRGVSFANVLEGQVNISIAQNQANESFVINRRDHTDCGSYHKNHERIKEWLPRFIHHLRKLVFPERNKAAGLLEFILIDAKMDLACKRVEVFGGTAVRVLRSCERKVVGDLNEKLCQAVRMHLRLVFHDLLKFLPTGFVLLYKSSFFHVRSGISNDYRLLRGGQFDYFIPNPEDVP